MGDDRIRSDGRACRGLAAAVLVRVARDLERGLDTREGYSALEFATCSSWFEELGDAVGYAPSDLRERLGRLIAN